MPAWTMKLVTWNTQWCCGLDGVVSPRRIVEQARCLADFDVLCLQEIAQGYDALAGAPGDQPAQLAALLPGFALFFGAAVDEFGADGGRRRFGNLDAVLVESGGDNLAATFSPELADLTIYVIDVAGGEKIPRKGGPGITKSDLFVINKTDLAPHVGADLGVMEADTQRMRGAKPYVMSNLRTQAGLAEVVDFIETRGMLR